MAKKLLNRLPKDIKDVCSSFSIPIVKGFLTHKEYGDIDILLPSEKVRAFLEYMAMWYSDRIIVLRENNFLVQFKGGIQADFWIVDDVFETLQQKDVTEFYFPGSGRYFVKK